MNIDEYLKKHKIEKKEFIEFYTIQKGSLNDLARKYSLTLKTISKYLGLLGIKRRSISEAKSIKLDKEQLKNLYIEKRLTIEKISKILNVSDTLVWSNLKKYDISRSRIRILIDKNILNNFYINKKLSIQKIAKCLDVSEYTIYSNLKRFSIPRRKKNYRGKRLSQKTKDKISRTARNKPKRKLSVEIIQKMQKNRIIAMANHPTKFQSSYERNFESKVLNSLSIDYKRQFWIKGLKHPFDFAIPEWKLLIEIDGAYWHSLPKNAMRDKEVSMYVENSDWNLIRINEQNLKEYKIIG